MPTKSELLQKLFNNQCSQEELTFLFELLRADKGETGPEIMTKLLEQIDQVPKINPQASQRILHRVKVNINTEEQTAKRSRIASISSRRIFLFAKAAALILVLIIASWSIYQFTNAPSLIQQATDYDEIKIFKLPDGSEVTLNGNSAIEYLSQWTSGEARIVHLQGEAYFKVEKKPATNAKFKVITNDLQIEVLGTAFNVNTRQEITKVFLEEGTIKLNLEDQKESELYLKPGEVVSYSATKKILVSPQAISKDIHTSWKEGVLTFKEASLMEILEILLATNNIEFEVAESTLLERKYSLSLPSDDIKTAMDILSKTTNTTFSRRDNKYIIKSKHEE